jgi:hypothetical protein
MLSPARDKIGIGDDNVVVHGDRQSPVLVAVFDEADNAVDRVSEIRGNSLHTDKDLRSEQRMMVALGNGNSCLVEISGDLRADVIDTLVEPSEVQVMLTAKLPPVEAGLEPCHDNVSAILKIVTREDMTHRKRSISANRLRDPGPCLFRETLVLYEIKRGKAM